VASFWGGVVAASVALVFALFGGAIIDVLTTAEDVRAAARSDVIWLVLVPLVGLPAFMLDGIFIGATRTRDMRNMMAVSVAAYFIAAPPLVGWLGSDGLWAALMLSFVLRGATLGLRYPALERSVAASVGRGPSGATEVRPSPRGIWGEMRGRRAGCFTGERNCPVGKRAGHGHRPGAQVICARSEGLPHHMTIDDLDIDTLVACPNCDAVYHAHMPEPGQRGVCGRCHSVLMAPRRRAGMTIIMLALSVVVMVFGALWFPFLKISSTGFSNSATVFDSILAFTDGPLLFLSLCVAAFIVLIPLMRALLIVYVLTPVVFDRPPARSARQAFRISEALRPWSMAEIFAIGCAVALVKVADLARIEFGPAFYMFAGLVILSVVQDNHMCRWSIWASLDAEDDQTARGRSA